MKFSISAQIVEVEREIALRRSVYARLAYNSPSKKSECEYFMARMEAVLDTLRFLEKHGERFKDFVKETEA